MLADSNVRERVLEEISNFEKNELPLLKLAFTVLKPHEQLPFITGPLANYLITVLRNFKSVILRDFANRGWFTSDNPVCFDFKDNYEMIIPPDAEIYFPLLKDYCLFMYFEKALDTSNPLRNLATNEVHNIDEATHDMIIRKIVDNPSRTIVFPKQHRDSLVNVNLEQLFGT